MLISKVMQPMIPQITVPLVGIPDVIVTNLEQTIEGDFMITVESVEKGTACKDCGQWIDWGHGHDNVIVLRHISIFDRPVYIRLRPARYRCAHCPGNPTTTQRVPWYEPRSPHTNAFDEHLVLRLINSTMKDVSIQEGITYDAVKGAIARQVETEVDWERFERLEVLGLDEISLKKGHKDFIAIASAHSAEGVVLLGVLADRKKATVEAFLRGIPPRLRKTIHTVCCDMYDGFVNAAKAVLSKRVAIVTDRFHVAKHYRDGVDRLRKSEL